MFLWGLHLWTSKFLKSSPCPKLLISRDASLCSFLLSNNLQWIISFPLLFSQRVLLVQHNFHTNLFPKSIQELGLMKFQRLFIKTSLYLCYLLRHNPDSYSMTFKPLLKTFMDSEKASQLFSSKFSSTEVSLKGGKLLVLY